MLSSNFLLVEICYSAIALFYLYFLLNLLFTISLYRSFMFTWNRRGWYKGDLLIQIWLYKGDLLIQVLTNFIYTNMYKAITMAHSVKTLTWNFILFCTVKPVLRGHLCTVKPVLRGHLYTVKPVLRCHFRTVKAV
jgi:hypothetical protein